MILRIHISKSSKEAIAREDGGVHLREVPDWSPPAKAGLRAGDLIQGVNGKPLRTSRELVDAMQIAGSKSVTIHFIRHQAKQQTTLAP